MFSVKPIPASPYKTKEDVLKAARELDATLYGWMGLGGLIDREKWIQHQLSVIENTKK